MRANSRGTREESLNVLDEDGKNLKAVLKSAIHITQPQGSNNRKHWGVQPFQVYGVSTLVWVTKCCHLSLWKVQVWALMCQRVECLSPSLTCMVVPGGSRATLALPDKAVHSGLLTHVSAVPKPESQNSTVHRLKQKPAAKWSCPHRPADPEENETLSFEEMLNVTLFMARGKKQICNFKSI